MAGRQLGRRQEEVIARHEDLVAVEPELGAEEGERVD